MVLIIVIISLWFYLKYFTKNFEDAKEAPVTEKIDANKNSNKIIEKIVINQNNTSTYIDDINYVSTDTKGNKYQITAKQAEIENENSDVMFLREVVAFIFIKDSDKIEMNLTTKDTKIFMIDTGKKILIEGTK